MNLRKMPLAATGRVEGRAREQAGGARHERVGPGQGRGLGDGEEGKDWGLMGR